MKSLAPAAKNVPAKKIRIVFELLDVLALLLNRLALLLKQLVLLLNDLSLPGQLALNRRGFLRHASAAHYQASCLIDHTTSVL